MESKTYCEEDRERVEAAMIFKHQTECNTQNKKTFNKKTTEVETGNKFNDLLYNSYYVEEGSTKE